jgi:sugar phosphate isomerase/epimerase
MLAEQIHPRVAVNAASSINWTLDEDIAFYRECGITNVTVFPIKFRDGAAAGIAAIKAAGLTAAGVMTAGGPLVEGPERALELLKSTIETARELNCRSAYTMTGPTPPRMSSDQAYQLLVEALRPVSAYAREAGVRLAIEPNSQATRHLGFIHTVPDAIDLSRDADVGICLELQNCWYERHLKRLFRDNVGRFTIVQVNDFLVGEEPRLNRRVPGDGSMPLEWMLGALLEAGYEGCFDLEFLGPAIEREGYAAAIRRGVEWLSTRLQSWGV